MWTMWIKLLTTIFHVVKCEHKGRDCHVNQNPLSEKIYASVIIGPHNSGPIIRKEISNEIQFRNVFKRVSPGNRGY